MQEANLKTAVMITGLTIIAGIVAVDQLTPYVATFNNFMLKPYEAETDIDASHKQDPVLVLEEQLLSSAYKDVHQRFTLHTSVGNLYRDRGGYKRAFWHYEEAHRLATELESDERSVTALHLLGFTCFLQGKLQAAQQFLEEAQHFESVLHTPRVKLLHTLANVRRDMGHLDTSLELYWEAWKAATRRGHLDAELLPVLVADIAEAHVLRGELDTAHGYLQQALDQYVENMEFIDERILGSHGTESMDLDFIRSAFGRLHHARGNIKKAMEFYGSAYRRQAQLLRPGHPELVATEIGIARAQRDLGETEIALKTTESIETALRQGTQEGPDLSRVLILKADMLHENQRFVEAEQAIQEALQLQSLWYADEDHPEVAVASVSYASILHQQGKFEAALRYYSHALEVSMNTVGERHPETAAIHNRLGTVYVDVGDSKSASEHFTTCLSIQLSTVGERSLDVGTTYNNLATLMFRQGMAKDAVQYLRKALHALDLAGVPQSNPERVIYAENLSEVLSFCKSKGLEELSCQGADEHYGITTSKGEQL